MKKLNLRRKIDQYQIKEKIIYILKEKTLKTVMIKHPLTHLIW